MSIAATDNAYNMVVRARYQETRVQDEQLQAFAKALNDFEYQLGDLKDDDYWQTKLRLLKRYRFRLISTSLAFNDVPNAVALWEVVAALRNCEVIYPQHAEVARDVAKQVNDLLEREDNPLLRALLEQVGEVGNEAKRAALLIKEARFVEDVERQCERHLTLRHLKVVTPRQLREVKLFDRLFICGPLRWLRNDEYVMTAPRAKYLHVIRYSFLGDGWEVGTDFVSQADTARTPLLRDIQTKQKRCQADKAEEILSADELMLPSVDWKHFARGIGRRTVDDSDESVKVRLCVLEHDCAIFLETDDSVRVIDTYLRQVRRVKVNELKPGLFVIMREKGSGDYIVPFANRILDQQANQQATDLRAKQQRWKTALRNSVKMHGIQHVKRDLSHWEAKSVSEQNIRNWMSRSERKIRPRHKEDFRAIMLHLGLDDDIDDYWTVARRISQAHLKAGSYMTKQLKQQLQNIDWQKLEQLGEETFALDGYDAHLQAYRIISIEPDTHEVPLSKVGEILSEDD